MNGRVFVTQAKHEPDAYRGPGVHPRINPEKFLRFGTPFYLCDDRDLHEYDTPSDVPFQIECKLTENDYDPRSDYLLICGDTGIGAMVFNEMMCLGGVRLLAWTKRDYRVVEVPG